MLYNKFCSIISCSVIIKGDFNYLSSQSPLCKADEIKVLDSRVVAVVPDFIKSYLLLFSVSFLFSQCLVLNAGTRIALHVRDMGEQGICIMGGSVLCFRT